MGELNQSFLDINFIEMLKYFLISIILLWDGAFALKYTEKRSVTSSTGKTFECFYTIVYTKEKLDKKKSKVECTPNTNGGIAIETFDLPDFGSAQVDTKIVKGKDKITILKKVDPPTSEPAGGFLGCTCRMPNPLMEMGTPQLGGRSLRKLENHLSKVTMRRDPESNKSELTPVAPLQPTNRLFIIKLLILAALIPTITTAITNALAAIGIGRSLPINVASEVEERKENLETVLNQLQSAERKFNNALGDHAEDRTFLISLIRDAIRNAIIAQIQAFLASLIPAGRSLNVEDRQFLLQQLLNQQQGGSTDGGSQLGSLLGGSTGGGSPLGSLLGGSTGGGSPLGSLLGINWWRITTGFPSWWINWWRFTTRITPWWIRQWRNCRTNHSTTNGSTNGGNAGRNYWIQWRNGRDNVINGHKWRIRGNNEFSWNEWRNGRNN